MKTAKLPTSQYLHECFFYYPDTGFLIWKDRPLYHFQKSNRDHAWEMRRRNATLSGKHFGSINSHGHLRGSLDRKSFYAHRIIWKMVHNEEPNIIDHVNGVPTDNRIENLVSGTSSENSRNMKFFKNNTSGRSGVYFHTASGGWYSRIRPKFGKEVSFYSKDRLKVEKWREEKEVNFGFSQRMISK